MISFFIPIHLSQTSNICSDFRQYLTSRQVSIMFFRGKTKKQSHSTKETKAGSWREPACLIDLASRQEFYHEFHRVCDLSYLHEIGSYCQKDLDDRFEVVGEGCHFRTWKVPLRKSRASSGKVSTELLGAGSAIAQSGAVVIKRALPTFWSRKSISRADWERALSVLHKASTCTLISPFLRIDSRPAGGLRDSIGNSVERFGSLKSQFNQDFSLVMPFGTLSPITTPAPQCSKMLSLENPGAREHIGKVKASLSQLIGETESWLLTHGVQIFDIPQVRWCGSVPIMVDISDAALIR
jgi:hypothetical protein